MTRHPRQPDDTPRDDDGAFDDSLRELFGRPQPPRGLRAGIVARVRQEAAPVSAGSSSGRRARRRRNISDRRRRLPARPAHPALPVIATAAALLIAVVAFLLLSQPTGAPVADNGETDAPRVQVTINERADGPGDDTTDTTAPDAANGNPEAVDRPRPPHNENQPRPTNQPRNAPRTNTPDDDGEMVETPEPSNDPAPANEPSDPVAPTDPPDHVERDPDPQPEPHPADPATDPVQPREPVAVLTLQALDGRQPRGVRELATGAVLRAGQRFELTSGHAVFTIAASEESTRFVVHGRSTVTLADNATADAPRLELEDGDLFIDAGWSPAGSPLAPVRIRLADCELTIDRPTRRGESAFAGHLTRTSSRRAELHVLAGGARARIDGQSLADGAEVDVDLDDDPGDRLRVRPGRADVPAWLGDDLGTQVVFAADFDDLPDAPDSPWYGSPRVIDVAPDSAGRCARVTAETNIGYQFAQLDAPDDMVPWQPGMELTFRVRVPSRRAVRFHLHMFDGTRRDNFARDFTLSPDRLADGEWHTITLSLDDLRDRETASQAPGPETRFVNLNFGVRDGDGIDIDDLRLVRRFR